MKTALIITLGTRDIQLKSDIDLKTTHPELYNPKGQLMARTLGKFLADNYQAYKDKISFPILTPTINYVIDENKTIDTLWLIATDQPSSIGFQYLNDSIEFGKLFQQKIIPQYYNQNQKPKIHHIFLDVITEGVAALDWQYDDWQKKISAPPLNNLINFDKIYLCNQAGIDAINNALLLNSLDFFGSRLTILGVNERTNLCNKLHFASQYLQKTEEKKLISLIESYNYAAVKMLDIPKPDIKHLAAYAENRFNFNFKKCVSIVNELNFKHNTYKDDLVLELNQIQLNEENLTRELIINAKIKYQQAAYVDFLLRFFRILESVTEMEVKNLLGFDFDNRDWRDKITAHLNKPENRNLKNYLNNIRINNFPLDYVKSGPLVNLKIILFFTPNHIYEKMDALRQMRNKSIGAHDFKPVSEEIIEEELQKQDFSIKEIFDYLEMKFGIQSNPFDAINRKIKELINL